MKLTRAIHDYINDCRLHRRSPQTIVTYENALGFLTRLALIHGRDEVAAVTPGLIREYFQVAADRANQTETVMKKRSALRGFVDWGMRRRIWLDDPMADAPSFKKPERLPRPFERHEREGLMGLPLDTEETALRAVLYHAGLRAGEVIGLQHADVTFDGNPGWIRVRKGKGQKERIIHMTTELEAALGDHMMDRSDPHAFVFSHRGGPWTHRMIRYRVARWGELARVEKCIPHRFRHTTATEYFESGVDPRAAQRALGHKHLSTTMLYTQVTDSEVAKAVRLREEMLARRAQILRQDSGRAISPRPETT